MDIQNILVSAIIVTYKRPVDILKRAVDSVVNQTYKNMEIIIVNDYPDDRKMVEHIEKMLDEYADSRIRYIVHEKNFGACKARNTGILASHGAFVELLDDDDEWLPEKTETQLAGFSSENVGIVTSPFYNITDSLPGVIMVRGKKSGDLSHDMLWSNRVGGTSMPMIRREALDVCGMFDEELLSSQDYDLWIRIAQKYEINCLDKPLIRRYMQEESITRNFDKQKQGFYRFIDKHKGIYEKDIGAYNYLINRKVNKWFERGYFKDALKLYGVAFKVKPFSPYNVIEPAKGILKYFGIGKRGNID